MTNINSTDAVASIFSILLGRPIDADTHAKWSSRLNLSEARLFDLMDSIMLSREFMVEQDSISRPERLRRLYALLKACVNANKNDKLSPIEQTQIMYRMVFNRSIDDFGMQVIQARIQAGTFSKLGLLLRMLKSPEFRQPYRRIKPIQRLHTARSEWVKQLPPANRVLDIGGSSPTVPEGALIELGYPHKPKELIIFDKPPEQQYWGAPNYSQGEKRVFSWGTVQYMHGYAEDIFGNQDLATQSFDMIFMGQMVEHIHVDKLPALLNWIHEHLNPGGHFYCDTPNRLITKYETGEDSYIDPDHKKEYTPTELITIFNQAGFLEVTSKGILEMPNVQATHKLDVSDYYDGQLLCDHAQSAYCFAVLGKRAT
ncbi:MAG TPA: methyltransferase domain-containing protein [Burkholderiaceae bacterium]|nr:methyltransferase domain-containing protein [Burkholderiaceae bacterium]